MPALYNSMLECRYIIKNQLLKLVLLFCLQPTMAFSADTSNQIYPEKWLTLNYYNKTVTGGYKSDIINHDFFLSKDGINNPDAEFIEFKRYLKEYISSGKNIEIMCRFPARLSLFQSNYDWAKNIKRPVCTDFENKNRPDKITSVSLVLANGYFENPGSYYGHNLLKFNYGDTRLSQESVDASINYGANATDSPGNPKYVFKGLLGLYDANYTRNNDFIYTNAYTNLQMRDVWEYELNLTKDDIRALAEHSWEMSFAKFKYYFLSDNCAHRISNLIAFLRGSDTFKIHGFWLTPVQVTRKLNDAGLIKKISYQPSLQTVFFKKYKKASKAERILFNKFFRSNDLEKKVLVGNLNPDTLVMALDYLDLEVAKITLKRKDEQKIVLLNKQRAVILNALYAKPASAVKNDFKVPEPEATAYSKHTSVIRIGYGWNRDNDFIKIGYRATNNDLLNIPKSGQEFSQFYMGNFELKKSDNDVKISKFILAEVMNLDTNPLPMSLTKKFSWHFKADYSERNNLCYDCSNAGIEAKLGKAIRLNDRAMAYLLTGARMHTIEENRDSFLTETTDAGFMLKTSENSVLGISTNFSYNIQDNTWDKLYKTEFSYSPKSYFDYRASIENDGKESAIFLSVGIYFD